MVGNLGTVTVAPARTSAPSAQKVAAVTLPTGNGAPSGGQDLPVLRQVVTATDLERSIRKLNATMVATQRNLAFRIDEGSGRTVITVVDATTKEVIRQIPSEEVLALSHAVDAGGGLLDARI